MKIFMAILAGLLFFEMIGDKVQKNRDNCTYAFIATVICIAVLYIIG